MRLDTDMYILTVYTALKYSVNYRGGGSICVYISITF